MMKTMCDIYRKEIETDTANLIYKLNSCTSIYGKMLKTLDQKIGRWVFKNDDDRSCSIFTCSRCGEQITLFDNTLKNPQEGHYNFCPNCGYRMVNTFEIYFSDLNEDAQKRLLEAVGAETAADMNWDSPIAMYDFETETE